MGIEVTYTVCPFCGLNRVKEKKGSRAILTHKIKTNPTTNKLTIKGRITFGMVDVQTGIFEDIRLAMGGTTGFIRYSTKSFAEVIHTPEYADFKLQILNQCLKIMAVINMKPTEKPSVVMPSPAFIPTFVAKPIPVPMVEVPTSKAQQLIQVVEYFKPKLLKSNMTKDVFLESFSGLTITMPDTGEKISTSDVDMKQVYEQAINKEQKYRYSLSE